MSEAPQRDTLSPESDTRSPDDVREPPRGFFGTLRQLGPGLIIAGSIVGSGELIATTKTGAQAGICLLWLIVVGCVIKVFVQIELGRYSITHGRTTLAALNTLPGRIGPVNWILWFWVLMMAATVGQLGAIVGGVGQALALCFPITGDYRTAIAVPSQAEIERYLRWEGARDEQSPLWTELTSLEQERIGTGQEAMQRRLDGLGERGAAALKTVQQGLTLTDPYTVDDRYWAAAAALFTVLLLYNGRYGLIQGASTALVVCFTFITLGNVYALQSTPEWKIPLSEWVRGMSCSLPRDIDGKSSLATALATFGIIGVGGTELISYPYWCIEKGYAKFTGRRSDDESWARRAQGWMDVMRIDAFVSMVVYTVATIAFFVMGVAVLHRMGLDPDQMRMVSTLAESYVPMFGEYAKWLFLIGAVAVLYSTFLVAIAAQTRIYTDALKVFGLLDSTSQKRHDRLVSGFGIVLPLLCMTMYLTGLNPVAAVLLSGTMQAIMLPMLGFAALYFRFRASDPRLVPGRLWDVMLVLSCLGLLVAGVWGAYTQFR
jgi:Mn2+/Fe2+ NRAMP family transporter